MAHGTRGRHVVGKGLAKSPSGLTAEERIGANITPQPNGCWTYRGEPGRYTHTSVHGEMVTPQRFVYETLVGPIDKGCHLHHTCENKRCCNPAHLVPLTPKEHKAAHKALQARPS